MAVTPACGFNQDGWSPQRVKTVRCSVTLLTIFRQMPSDLDQRTRDLALFNITGWVGIWAPATTQRNILEQLSHQLTRIAAMPDVQAKLAEAFMEPSPLGIDDFTTFVKGEYERWGKIARAAKVMND